MLMATLSEFEESHGFGAQKQISLRLGVIPIHQSYETLLSLATLGLFAAASLLKPGSPVQSLASTVDALIGTNEEQFLASLTDDDYERLVACSKKLIDVVGENENHLFAPLMDFIGNLIEKHEEKIEMTVQTELLPARGLEAAYGDDEPEYTLDMLIGVNPDYKGSLETRTWLPARGLEAAYGDDEPEYTLDMLIKANPDCENPAE